MRTLSINYPTRMIQKKLGEKLFVLEVIRDLDEAIDLTCAALPPEEQLEAFSEDLCPYFGILWPSAEALAIELLSCSQDIKGKSILEIGCGLGLPSMVANHLGAQVLATDFHPDVEKFFQRNCRHSSLEVNYQRLNWRDEGVQNHHWQNSQFDWVIGSDILYESKHSFEVAKGLLKFVKPGGTILLADPGRIYLKSFLEAMKKFGYHPEVTSILLEGKTISIFKFIAFAGQEGINRTPSSPL
jgi:predicted nicotinamide N-methyase